MEGSASNREPDWSLGRLSEAQLIQRYGGERYDTATQTRVQSLVERLRSGNPELAYWHFEPHILQSDVLNAWPMPPNRILITQGLIRFIDDCPGLAELRDDALAFILGHEMAHLIEHDSEHATELVGLISDSPATFHMQQAILHRIEYNADRRGALMVYQAQFDPFAGVVWCRASREQYGDIPEGCDHPTYAGREVQLQRFLLEDLTEAHHYFHTGVALLKKQPVLQRDLESAIYAFEMYLSQLPTDAEARYNLALACFQRGLIELPALPWQPWKLAVEIAVQPHFSQPQPKSLDHVPEAEHWVCQARIGVEMVLREEVSHAKSQRLLGDIALAYGKLNEAQECYRQALTLEPRNPEIHNNLGVALGLAGRWDEANQHFQIAVSDGAAVQNTLQYNQRLNEEMRRRGK